MLVKLNQLPDERDVSLFGVQSLFSSLQNQECECPFCGESACTILSENLLMGSQEQLDYRDLIHESMTQSLVTGGTYGGAKGSTCASTS